MNATVNKLFLAEDKFMLEMHLKQPGFTYCVCGLFTENKERIKKFEETGDCRYFFQNELDKACFQHDMASGDLKDLNRKIADDKVLRDKAFNIAKDTRNGGYQRRIASMVYKFFYKKLVVVVLQMRILETKNYLKSYTNRLLENLIKEKYTHVLQTIFGVKI